MIVLAHGPVPVAVAFLVVQQLFGDWAFATFFVHELALRQSVAPERVLGRVNAAMQLLTRGIYPLGALVGGALAQNFGIRATLAISVSGVALSSIWLIASPLRKLREIPA
jgi:predicted MFS family arabinose efflux permease